MSRNTIIGLLSILVLALLGLLIVLYLMLTKESVPAKKPLLRYSELVGNAPPPSRNTTVSTARYTRDTIGKLKLGMDLPVVQSILGKSGERLNFASAPRGVESYKWDTVYPTDIVITLKDGKVVGISAPPELTPGMIAQGTASKAAPQLVYRNEMVKSAFAKWDVSKGRIVIVAFSREIEGSDDEIAAKVFPKSAKDRVNGALFELHLWLKNSSSKPERYQFTLFKQASWPSVYSCDICGLVRKSGADAQRQIKNFEASAVAGSSIVLSIKGKSREPMFEDSIHARWGLDLRARLLVLIGDAG